MHSIHTWITEQTQAGFTREQLLSSMLASGWSADQALVHLNTVLGGTIAPDATPSHPAEHSGYADISTGHGQAWIDAGDKKVAVLSQAQNPRMVVLGGLLSESECDNLVDMAQQRLQRSETVQINNGKSQVHDARTSQGMFFTRGETALCQTIETRLARVMQWPVDHGEGLQVLRYGVGAQYLPHYDYFDPTSPGSASILRRGGQRIATMVMYLNTPENGGSTTFPNAGLEVMPHKGNAVFFAYPKADPSSLSLHAGAPVLQGEKWVATKWLRQNVFT